MWYTRVMETVEASDGAASTMAVPYIVDLILSLTLLKTTLQPFAVKSI